MIHIYFDGRQEPVRLLPGDSLDLPGVGLVVFHKEEEAIHHRALGEIRAATVRDVIKFVENRVRKELGK